MNSRAVFRFRLHFSSRFVVVARHLLLAVGACIAVAAAIASRSTVRLSDFSAMCAVPRPSLEQWQHYGRDNTLRRHGLFAFVW